MDVGGRRGTLSPDPISGWWRRGPFTANLSMPLEQMVPAAYGDPFELGYFKIGNLIKTKEQSLILSIECWRLVNLTEAIQTVSRERRGGSTHCEWWISILLSDSRPVFYNSRGPRAVGRWHFKHSLVRKELFIRVGMNNNWLGSSCAGE